MEFFRRVVGDSNDDNSEPLLGFTLEKIDKSDESDIDLDLLIDFNEDELRLELDSDDSNRIDSDTIDLSDPSTDDEIVPPASCPECVKVVFPVSVCV